jgi:hypothetical protein
VGNLGQAWTAQLSTQAKFSGETSAEGHSSRDVAGPDFQSSESSLLVSRPLMDG